MASIQIVVAVAENGVIGKDGDMPWRLPSDLKHFKQITMGCPIIMGRATWDSIGRALPGRLNIVISRTEQNLPDGVLQVKTPAAAMAACQDAATVMIVGGGQIYKIFENQAETVHLTQVHDTPDGDTYFSLTDPSQWQEIERKRFSAGENDSADYSFVTLLRR